MRDRWRLEPPGSGSGNGVPHCSFYSNGGSTGRAIARPAAAGCGWSSRGGKTRWWTPVSPSISAGFLNCDHHCLYIYLTWGGSVMGSIRGSSYYKIVEGNSWTQAEANAVAADIW